MGESVAAWDAEVGNASIVEGVTLGGSFEGFFILEDAVLKTSDLFCESMELHCSVGFTVDDGSEESVRNGVKEYRVDVVVGGEG